MIEIPLTTNNYIAYRNRVFIIQNTGLGTPYQFQWCGVQCKQFIGKGKVVGVFKSDNKWFNNDYWYKAVSWYLNENKLWFEDKDPPKTLEYIRNATQWNKYYDNLQIEAKEKAISAEIILDEILKEVRKNTKHKIEFNGISKQYGEDWGEAYIPILINNHKGVLTWQNCD